MITIIETIKDYLISLGFNVNSQSLNQARQAMRDAEGMVSRFAGTSVTQFAVAGAAVATFVIAANAALANFMSQLAQNDLEMEKWARSMYTTKDNAVALNNSLKVMGATMQDLYLSPELLENFNKLRQQSFQMIPPAEYANQMKFIRSIMFEFQRFKLEVTYALQWVGYYLFKYLEKPLQDMKLSFKGFNDMLVKTMPDWTKVIAQVLSWFVRLGIAAVTAGKAIVHLFQELPKSLVVAGGALTGLFAIMKMGPIGWMIAGFTALLLLIDDFQTYKSGGKSAFGDFWGQLNDNGVLRDTKKSIDDIVDSLGKVSDAITGLYKALLEGKELTIVKDALLFINTTLDNIATTIKTIANPFKALSEAFDKLGESWGNFKEEGGFPELKKKLEEESGLFNTWRKFQDAGGFGALRDALQKNNPTVTPQSYRGAISTNQTNNFSIYGSGDPNAVAMAVSRQMPTNIMIRNNGRVII